MNDPKSSLRLVFALFSLFLLNMKCVQFREVQGRPGRSFRIVYISYAPHPPPDRTPVHPRDNKAEWANKLSPLLVFFFGNLSFWSSLLLVILVFVHLCFWSSSFLVIFHFCNVVFLFGWGRLPFWERSSSIWGLVPPLKPASDPLTSLRFPDLPITSWDWIFKLRDDSKNKNV